MIIGSNGRNESRENYEKGGVTSSRSMFVPLLSNFFLEILRRVIDFEAQDLRFGFLHFSGVHQLRHRLRDLVKQYRHLTS